MEGGTTGSWRYCWRSSNFSVAWARTVSPRYCQTLCEASLHKPRTPLLIKNSTCWKNKTSLVSCYDISNISHLHRIPMISLPALVYTQATHLGHFRFVFLRGAWYFRLRSRHFFLALPPKLQGPVSSRSNKSSACHWPGTGSAKPADEWKNSLTIVTMYM